MCLLFREIANGVIPLAIEARTVNASARISDVNCLTCSLFTMHSCHCFILPLYSSRQPQPKDAKH